MEEQLKELTRSVREMRNAQKQYFLTKSPADLRTAKDWEKKVDTMVAQAETPADAKPEQPVQGTLFG